MCHVNALRAAKEDLPLPDPYKDMWKSIKKVIDRLHIVNHKDKKCRRYYNPDKNPAQRIQHYGIGTAFFMAF